ncbi:MAG: RidA family protein [Nitrososphaerota archaeon]|nr:RidA family protein [Nitrososphaerota archaeon]
MLNNREYVNPDDVPKPIGPYSQAVKCTGNLLVFVSGQVAENKDGELVGKGDPEKQARKAFENLKSVLLESDMNIPDIVKLTVILAERAAYPAVSKVRREFFKEGFPAATSFVVAGLAKPEWLVEVEAIAVK